MDKIVLKNMSFYGYHGVLAEEEKMGQRFFVDVNLFLDLQEAGATDDLRATINYAHVYEIVEAIVTKKRFKLLEALAKSIIVALEENFPLLQGVKVAVRKPSVPIAGILDYAEVTLESGVVG